jgi:UDP-glucose 4-epimerase
MDVVGLDDYSGGTTNVPLLSDIRIVKGDLTNSTFLAGLFAKHQFDIVYHTSQLAGSDLSHHYPSKIYTTNLVSSHTKPSCLVRM